VGGAGLVMVAATGVGIFSGAVGLIPDAHKAEEILANN